MTNPRPDDPTFFRGKYAEWMEWASRNWARNPDWCSRHWAPCPVEGRAGMAAAVILIGESLKLMPPDVLQGDGLAKEVWRHAQLYPTCCRLGEEKVAEIWDRCRPEAG